MRVKAGNPRQFFMKFSILSFITVQILVVITFRWLTLWHWSILVLRICALSIQLEPPRLCFVLFRTKKRVVP